MKIAVVGSRTWKDKSIIYGNLNLLSTEYGMLGYELVTGGAPGVDTFAIEWAKEKSIPCEVIRPIDPKNKLDYLFRNVEIITKADKILIFWDGNSKGTQFVINYAKARGKSVIVIK